MLSLYRLLIVLVCCAGFDSRGETNGTAATSHPLATMAAIRAMQQGGNAIDGTVAAALTLGVVDGHNSGIGGGCFMLIRQEHGAIVAIDGREANARVYDRMFLAATVPAGKHEILWTFRPFSLIAGALVSIVTLVTLLFALTLQTSTVKR